MIYSFKDLKGVLKVGDTVRAVEGVENVCSELICNGSNTQKITELEEDGFWINGCWHRFSENSFLEIIDPPRTEITWENLQAGDYLINKQEKKRKVLAIIGELLALSYGNYPGLFSEWSTLESIQKSGLTIDQPTPAPKMQFVREVTMEEVCKQFGCEVRIKKE